MRNLFTKENLDEIVFVNRNKAYGAYALRNNYANDLTKAVCIGVAFFASLAIVPMVISAFSTDVEVLKKPDLDGLIYHPVNIDPNIVKPTPTVAQSNIKTVVSSVVTPVRDLTKNSTLPTVEELKGAAVGVETRGGEETTASYAPPATVFGPPVIAPPSVPKPSNPDELFTSTSVDVAADFKGGINAFREKVSQNFDTESVANGGMITAVITFVVEKDGSISNLKINGSNSDFNKEAERVVKSIKTKWTPAQLQGKSVRSSFRMPISMKIE